MRHYQEVFRDKTARALFTSAAVSGLGDWVGLAALVVLAFERSGSSVGPGALFLVQGLGAITATSLLGPQLDRFDRARALTVCYVIGAASVTLPLLFSGLWAVIAASTMVGILRPTSAALRHAIAGNELDSALLGPVVALQKATGDVTAAIGLATGGLLTVFIGPSLSLGLDSLTFLAAGVLVLTLPRGRGAMDVRRSPFRGYAVWLRDPALRSIMLVIAAIAAVGALPETLAPEIVGDSAWFAAVVSSQALGTAAGGLLIGHRRDLERAWVLITGLGLSGALLLLGALVVGWAPWALTGANFLLGAAFSVMVLGQTAITRRAPKDRIGAVIASAITTVMLAEGIGSVIVGGISDLFGPAAAYASPGVLVLISAGLLALLAPSEVDAPAPAGEVAATSRGSSDEPSPGPSVRAVAESPWPPPDGPPVRMLVDPPPAGISRPH